MSGSSGIKSNDQDHSRDSLLVRYTRDVAATSRQLALPLVGTGTPGTDEYLDGPSGPLPLRFARHPRARRYVLRVDDDGVARLTMPRWGRPGEAKAFAAAHVSWIERQRASLVKRRTLPRDLATGSLVLIRGEQHPVGVRTAGGTMVVRIADVEVRSDWSRPLRASVVHALKALARKELPVRLEQLANQCGLSVTSVSIRDQRTRWGSCAASGRISLNWRLVQMPLEVRDYVLYHELMHLRVRNHSARFWRQVAQVCPAYESSRQWLREEARHLL